MTEIPHAGHTRPRSGTQRRIASLLDVLRPSWAPERASAASHVEALRGALAERRSYDLVIVEHAGLRDLVSERRPGERWLLTVHNVDSATREQRARQLHGRRAWLMRREAARSRAFEARTADGYDVVVSVSEADAELLPWPSVVVPNGVDAVTIRPTPMPAEPVVLFSASFVYAPNVHGAEWLAREIWPLVRDAVPAARLRLVGREPVDAVRRLADLPGVEGAWDVPEMAPYLAGARVAVVPLREGSGTRLKALEAMAAGRPLVGTPIGLAGLGIVDGEHALVRGDAKGFADAIIELLATDALAERLVGPARRLAESYDWDLVARGFLAVALSDN